MKEYLYYLRDSNKLYAYTNEKSYEKLFRRQRDNKAFTRVVLDLDNEYDKRTFQKISMDNKLNNYEMYPYSLTDGNDELDMMMVNHEYVSLMESCEYIENFLYTLRYDNDSYYSLSEKEAESLKLLSSLHETCEINTFRIFYRLFDFTFNKDIKEEWFAFYSF